MTATDDGDESPPVDGHWGSRVAATVGQQVAHYRDRHRGRRGKMSARELSEATAALGFTVTRSNIANLESGRRPSVSVPEVIALARALDVPVVALLVPLGTQPSVEILPGLEVSTAGAVAWLSGLDAEAGRPWPPAREEHTNGWEMAEYAHAHNGAVTRLRAAMNRVNGSPDSETFRAMAYAEFAVLRRQRDRLQPVPPALPPDLLWVDETEAADRRRGYPGGVGGLAAAAGGDAVVVRLGVGGVAPAYDSERGRSSPVDDGASLPQGWRPGDVPPWGQDA